MKYEATPASAPAEEAPAPDWSVLEATSADVAPEAPAAEPEQSDVGTMVWNALQKRGTGPESTQQRSRHLDETLIVRAHELKPADEVTVEGLVEQTRPDNAGNTVVTFLETEESGDGEKTAETVVSPSARVEIKNPARQQSKPASNGRKKHDPKRERRDRDRADRQRQKGHNPQPPKNHGQSKRK